MPVVTKEELLNIHICIAHAHQKDVENPGTYGEELNKVLVGIGLPKIITDDSNKVLMQKDQHSTQEQSVRPKPIRRREFLRQSSETEASDTDQESSEKHLDGNKELGLTIYTTYDKRWPTKKLHISELSE